MSDGGDTTALERAFREDRAAVLAAVARRVGDLQIAEDATQDAFAAAVTAWGDQGVPDAPRNWLVATAWRKAVDRLRRDRAQSNRNAALAAATRTAVPPPTDHAVADDLLQLIVSCCHPALTPEARVALTLRCVAGLNTAEIARAFVIGEATMAQRIVRAKRKVRDAGIRLAPPTPTAMADRLDSVRAVVYLIFTEGHAASQGDDATRADLCTEAIWLARLLRRLAADDPESSGLLALVLLHHARAPARTTAAGRAVPLDRQDRSAWDQDLIAEGLDLVSTGLRGTVAGRYWLEAAIAAEHMRAPSLEGTDWTRIVELYRALWLITGSPVVAVNRAVAVGRADGPAAGLAVLMPVLVNGELDTYAPLHAAHADLLERAGDLHGARAAWQRAHDLTDNAAYRAELARRVRAVSPEPSAERSGSSLPYDA